MLEVIKKINTTLKTNISAESFNKLSSFECHLMVSILREFGYEIKMEQVIKGFILKNIIENTSPNVQIINESKQPGLENDQLSAQNWPTNDNSMGIDIVNIKEFRNKIDNQDLREISFVNDIFFDSEIAYSIMQSDPIETLAGIFAAKEAVLKATHNYSNICEIKISRDTFGAPTCPGCTLSISHENDYAVAVASVTGKLGGFKSESNNFNLLVYCDSLGFRRPPQDLSFEITYPVLLSNKLEAKGWSNNFLLRGSGGANTKTLARILATDAGYLTTEKTKNSNIVVLQCGIVDASRFTDFLKKWWFLRPILSPIVKREILKRFVELKKVLKLFPCLRIYIIELPEHHTTVAEPELVSFCNSQFRSLELENLEFIPLNWTHTDFNKYTFDSDHFTTAGHENISDLFLKRIMETYT